MAWKKSTLNKSTVLKNSSDELSSKKSNKESAQAQEKTNCSASKKKDFKRKIIIELYKISYKTGKKTIDSIAFIYRALKKFTTNAASVTLSRISDLISMISEFKKSRAGRGELSITRTVFRVFRNMFEALCVTGDTFLHQGPINGFKTFFKLFGSAIARFWVKNRKLFNYAAPAAAIFAFIMTVSYWSNISFALKVTYNGKTVGIVKTEQAYKNAVDDIEQRVADASGSSFTLNSAPVYKIIIAKKSDFINEDDMCSNIVMASGSEVSDGFGLYIDNRLVGVNKDSNSVQQILDGILQRYKKDKSGESVEFVQNVAIKKGIFPVSVEKSADEIKSIVTSNVEGQQVYKAKKGDSPIKIAKLFKLPLQKFLNMNPIVASNGVAEGQSVIVTKAQPYLRVKTIRNEVFDRDIGFSVQKVPNSSLYKNQTKVAMPGAIGKQEVLASVTYVDGNVVDKRVITARVVKKPVEQIVYVGTKELPSTTASGTFSWPVPSGIGYISCPFGGYRGHTGMDIACNQGTPVMASDAGTVVLAGWDSGYGNCVHISHGNGIISLYGHNSALLVKAGQKVYKGQVIALSGHTGNVRGATGNHVHFEIRVDGTAVNPMRYLKGR